MVSPKRKGTHRVCLCYRHSSVEKSMISFIRDKLARRGCDVISDITQCTTVLVLLTPGVFEFIDDEQDPVRMSLAYALRRLRDNSKSNSSGTQKVKIIAITCDLFAWPKLNHLPDDVKALYTCNAIEWSPENRDAFLKRLLTQIDPALLEYRSPPSSPNPNSVLAPPLERGDEHRDVTSATIVGSILSHSEEDGDDDDSDDEEGLVRQGSAFYYDELNAHVSRKSNTSRPYMKNRRPPISDSYVEPPVPVEYNVHIRNGETTGEADDSHTQPPESVSNDHVMDIQAERDTYTPPPPPTVSVAMKPSDQQDPDPRGVASVRGTTTVQIAEKQRTASIGVAKSGKTAVFVPTPVPGQYENSSNKIDADKARLATGTKPKKSREVQQQQQQEKDQGHPSLEGMISIPLDSASDEIEVEYVHRKANHEMPRSMPFRPREGAQASPGKMDPTDAKMRAKLEKKHPKGITTTVEIHSNPGTSRHEQEPSRTTRPVSAGPLMGHGDSDQPRLRHNVANLPTRPVSAGAIGERGIDADGVPQVQRPRTASPLEQASRDSHDRASKTLDRKQREQKSMSLGFLHARKTFTLPQKLQLGRYPDEHPYWNMGRYRKFAMDDEFCDESYYANQSHTLPAMSMRKLADSEFVGSAEVHRDEVGESLGPSSIRHRPRTSTSSSVEETNRVRPGYDTEEPTEYEDGQLLSVDTYAPPALPRSREDLEYVSDKRGKDEGQVTVEDTSCKPPTLSGASNDKAMRIGDSHHEHALLVEDERSNTASLVADINQGQQLRDRSPSVIVSEDTSVKRFTRSDSPERCAGEHADEFEARKENAGSTPKERRKSFQIFGETSDSDENENAYQPLAQPSLRKVKPVEDLSKEADGPATNCEHTMDTYQEPQPVIDYHRRSDQSHVAEISPHSAEGTSVSVIHTAHEANANSDAIHKFALETVDQLDIADVYQSQLLAPRRVHARHIAPSEVKAFKPDVRQAVEAVVYERDVDRTPPSATHSDRNEQHEGSEYQRPPLSAAMVDVQPPLVEEVRKIEPVYHRPLSRLSVNKSDHSKPTTIEQCLARSDGQSSSQARDFVSTSPPSTGDTYEAPLTPTAESHPAAHGVKKYVGHIAHHKESVSERRSSEAAVEDTYVRPLVSPSAKHTQANVNGSSRMERIRPVEPSSTNETYKPPPATAPSARYTNDDVMQEVTGFIEQPVQRATVSVASTTVDNYKERPTPAPRRHSTKNDATGGGSMSNVGHVLPAGTSTVEIIDNRPDETTTEVHRITSIRAHVKEGAVVPKAPADTSAPLIVDTFQKPPIYRKPVLNNTTGVNVKAKEFHMEPNRPIDGTPLSSAGDRYEKPPSPVPHSSVTSGHIHDHYIEFAPAKTISVRSSTSSAENTDKGPSTPILGSSTNRDDNRDFSISRIEHSQSATSKSSTYETFEDVYERPSTPSSDTPPIHRSSSSDAEETNRSNIPKHQAKAHQAPYHRQEQGSRARDTYIRPRTPSTGDTESSGAQSVGSDGDEKRIPRKESKAKTEVSPVERRCRQLEKNKSASGDRERRTRSLIEPAVSESVMPPRRRANTSDLILSKELEAFVNQHHCDPICCSLVCPKRLARSPYVMHDADRLNSYTNLDILKRRRLSYLLAIEAQSFLRDHGSKYISAACDMLADDGYKSPDSGCEPSSKISDGSDAMLADDDSSSVDEEQVNHELAKIEHRRLSIQPELVWKPLLIPAPTEFREAVATQMDDTYREPEPPIYENIHEGTIKVSQAKNGEPRQITTTQTFVDAAEPRKPNMPPMPRTAFSAAASSENAHRQQHDQDKSGATTAVPSRLTDVVHQSPPEPSRNKSRVTEFAAQQMLGDARTAPSVDRETIKAQFEGQIVCEALPRNPKQNAAGEKRPALATPQSEVSESTARFALDSWRSIWKGVPSEEVPQLSDDEIISLHDSILSILADRVTLKGVRAALRDAIRKVLQKTQLVTSQQKFDVTWRRQDISWQSQNTRYEKPETEQRAVDGTQRRPPAQEQANEELVTQRF